MDDLAEDVTSYGDQTNASPGVTVTQITHFVSHCHLSLNMHIYRCGVSVSSACSISAVTSSAPHTCLCALHHFIGSFQLSHGRWICADIKVLYCQWNLSYLECSQNVPSSLQAFLLLLKEHCNQGHCCF